ncbi:MAG: hypothetical protein ABT11_18735 [Novosphingobium sp. SCN 66-18]|nr:MAG: hypothetical protein ABT11_18735 [Novosphingobium sp. SCN 66-18]
MRDLTPRIALELIAHEGVAREAYRDSVGVWTWSVGITQASGHAVFPRYKDNPQPLEHCLAVFLWLLRTKYLSAVLAAFGAVELTEPQLGAALSFHWNTAGARVAMLDWARPPALLPRRRREQALFFDGVWTADGTALVYDVAKPAYRPAGANRVAIAPAIARLFAGEPRETATPA